MLSQYSNSLQTKLDDTKFNLQSDAPPTIFRVPNLIREMEPVAYDPSVVALGPYNHEKLSLTRMEGLKWKCLKAFLARNNEKGLNDYVMEVRRLELKARSAYREVLEINSDEFVKTMLLDCCFVIELLRTVFVDNDDLKNHELVEDIKNNCEMWTIKEALSDMLLAKNQLPVFLLQSLCSLNDTSFDLCNIAVILVIVSCPFLFYDFNVENFSNIVKSQKDELHHFLHLLHTLLTYDIQKKLDDASTVKTPSSSNMMQRVFEWKNGLCEQSSYGIFSCSMIGKKMKKLSTTFPLFKKELSYMENNRNITVPNATKLKEAGLKFKMKNNPISILDVTCHNGIVYIPQLHVYDNTSYTLRNLIVFEQLFICERAHVCSYVDFIDSLLDTADDVAELQKEGIINNGVGSNETIAILFNQMCKRVYLTRDVSYLQPVCSAVNKYANKRHNQWREKLNHDYFTNPWSISFIAAFLLLLFTLTQTIFAIVAYVKPPHLG